MSRRTTPTAGTACKGNQPASEASVLYVLGRTRSSYLPLGTCNSTRTRSYMQFYSYVHAILTRRYMQFYSYVHAILTRYSLVRTDGPVVQYTLQFVENSTLVRIRTRTRRLYVPFDFV